MARSNNLEIAVMITILLLAASCGGGSSSVNQNMTQAQAQAVSQELVTTMQNALSSLSGVSAHEKRASLSAILRNARAQQSSDCTVTDTGETCNIPISVSDSCPGGGTIGVSGDFDFTLDNSGDGSDTASITITPTNCSVDNLTLNGNPNVSVATQITFQAAQPNYPITLTESGGITYGPNPSGNCNVAVTVSVTSQDACTITGTICGQSVTGSC
jgi:hypothetical protein